MSKNQVTQEYFDSIVQENIDEFSMTLEEALVDAIEQLKSQNINLTNIVKFGSQEINMLTSSIDKLSSFIDKSVDNDDDEKVKEIKMAIEIAKEKFQKDISFRVLATKKSNANHVFIRFLQKFQLQNEFILDFIQMYNLYLTNQTDVLILENIRVLISLTKEAKSVDLLKNLLKLLVTTCVLCEKNRQMYVENGLCELLIDLFQTYKTSNLILIEICNLIRNLLLDDDLRVEFGRSHEHAKFIASQLNGLDVLLSIALCKIFRFFLIFYLIDVFI